MSFQLLPLPNRRQVQKVAAIKQIKVFGVVIRERLEDTEISTIRQWTDDDLRQYALANVEKAQKEWAALAQKGDAE